MAATRERHLVAAELVYLEKQNNRVKKWEMATVHVL